MPFSTAYANEILDYTLSRSSNVSPAPDKVYIGLSSNDPEADGGVFNELSGGNYERTLVSVRNNQYVQYFGNASNRMIKNSRQINWNKATTDWGIVRGFGLFSSETGGSPYFYGKIELLDNPGSDGLAVPIGAVALFDAGMLRLSFSTHDELETAAAATTGTT